MSLYDLDSVKIIRVGLGGCKLHFGVKAFSNCFQKLVVSDTCLIYFVR